MYSVDVYLRVRRAAMVEGMSIREIARRFGLPRVRVSTTSAGDYMTLLTGRAA